MNGFLFDENLPRRLRFTPSRPVTWATTLGPSATDDLVWQVARDDGLAVVTKDADFSDRIMASFPPPWVVHLRFGNLRRAEYHAFLARAWPAVESAASRAQASMRLFGPDRIRPVTERLGRC